MTHAIDMLREEHGSMSRLLHLMDKLQKEMRGGQEPDIPLLREIGEYLHGFPDQCHHPKEDLIYRRLSKLEPGLREIGTDLEYEHERLVKLTGRFRESLVAAQQGSRRSTDRLVDSLDDLAKTYRRHMEMEERHLFPMAIRKLSGDDWAEINDALFDEADPLGDDSSAMFAKLREAIAKHAVEHDERVRLLAGEGALDVDPASLETLEQLNSILASQNITLRKREAAKGGFELLEADTILLEIPPCSEARAVWCAYFYIKGGM
jgi:hemerythrin-like domain-containing protein